MAFDGASGPHTANNIAQIRDQAGSSAILREFTYLAGKQTGMNTTDGTGELVVDLSEATGATINSLRTSFQVQKLLEKDARSGTRYTEILKSHFGVTSPDSRLQRPEYLGGGSTPVILNPVAKTDANVGELAA